MPHYMKKMLAYTASLALLAGPVLANPVQVSRGGDPNQSQVYGDGSANSNQDDNANSNRNANFNSNSNSNRNANFNSNSNTNRNTNSVSSTNTNRSTSSAAGGSATGGAGGSSTSTARGGTARGGAGGSGGAGGVSNVTVNGGGLGGGGGIGSGNSFPVATATAPAVMSFNPCSGSSTSGGLQTGPVGLSFGTGGGFDNACRLHMLGHDDAAVAFLCRSNNDIRQAFADIGQPCPQDRPKVVAVAAPLPPNQRFKYDYCATASAGELKQHKECEAVAQ
jgi:hypothetical protein